MTPYINEIKKRLKQYDSSFNIEEFDEEFRMWFTMIKLEHGEVKKSRLCALQEKLTDIQGVLIEALGKLTELQDQLNTIND